MATTPNHNLTLLEVGQKEKEVTINTNFTTLDAIPKFLGSLSAAPTNLTNIPVGSYYYDPTFTTMHFLINKTGPIWS